MSGERVLSTLNMILLQVAGLGVLLFWVMGAVLLLTGNGGQITDLNLHGFWRTVYFSYPFLLIFLSAIGWLAFWRKADLVGMAALAVPPGVLFLMYLVFIMSPKPL